MIHAFPGILSGRIISNPWMAERVCLAFHNKLQGEYLMFTFQNFPLVVIIVLLIISWLSFFSVVPWGNLF